MSFSPDNQSPRHQQPNVARSLLQTSPRAELPRESRASTVSSRTESMLGEPATATEQGERTPLLPPTSNKGYTRDENFANNLPSIQDSSPLRKTPPPKSKLATDLSVPNLNTTSTTTPSLPDSGETGFSVREEGPPAINQLVDAPHRARDPPPRITCGYVAKKTRMGCCCLSVFIVLAGLIMLAVWPTVISLPHDLQANHTVPIGLVQIKPKDILTTGGMTVTLNLSNVTDLSSFPAKYYYGPTPPSRLYSGHYDYAYIPMFESITVDSDCYMFDPFVLETGRDGGDFSLDIVNTTSSNSAAEIHIYVSVFADYDKALTMDCQHDPACTHEVQDEFEYTYNSTADSCGRPSSYYGLNRYIRIDVKSFSGKLDNLTFDAFVRIKASGTLNITAVGEFNNCSTLDKNKTVTCEISFKSFFEEASSDNYVLIATNPADLKDNDKQRYSENITTVVTVSSHEALRSDVLWFIVGVILGTILVVVVCYCHKQLCVLLPRHSYRGIKWGVTHRRAKATYNWFAGEHPPPGP